MRLTRCRLGFASILLLALGMAGCGADVAGTGEESNDATHAAHDEGHDGEELDLSYLSPEDQAAAKEQKFCPVGGPESLLGSAGMKAVKVSVEGREVFLCCAGCEEELRSDPEKYFAVLDGTAAEETE